MNNSLCCVSLSSASLAVNEPPLTKHTAYIQNHHFLKIDWKNPLNHGHALARYYGLPKTKINTQWQSVQHKQLNLQKIGFVWSH